MTDTHHSDFLIIGGGIIGLATAWRLSNSFPDASICVLEKESAMAAHQSGHNSGVLHSGIYYRPGSLKAETCRAGRAAIVDFCLAEGIPFETCGKLIVAVNDEELPRLESIHQRGIQNGIPCSVIENGEIREFEPHAAGLKAIHVPDAGIVDYPAVVERLAGRLCEGKGSVRLGQRVVAIQANSEFVEVRSQDCVYRTGYMVACAGLHSDRLARMAGLEPPAKIVPFRGEYYELLPERRQLCRNLIYPVPDPAFPFLGVHFTRMTSGDVECGPNAVLALAREGYSWGQVRPLELFEALRYRGFRKLAGRNWRMGLGEIHRSLSKRAFVKALQRLIPTLRAGDLRRGRTGVRAQALAADGSMIDDFLWVTSERMLHVLNAPSPAATASLEIGSQIATKVAQQLESL